LTYCGTASIHETESSDAVESLEERENRNMAKKPAKKAAKKKK